MQRFTPLLIDAARPCRHGGARPERLRSARVISTGHAFVQNIRRGHYELGVDADQKQQKLPTAFAELTIAI